MKHILTTLFLLLSIQFIFAQKDTIVYYKNFVPQSSSEYADYQVIVRQQNKKTSILQKCALMDGKWKVLKTETLKLKENNCYLVSDEKSHYQRKFEKIEGGFLIEDYDNTGKLNYKGLSKTLFPLHREGQWQNFQNGKLVGINVYKNEFLTKSYLIGINKEHLPTNTLANADSLASYLKGNEKYPSVLAKNIKYPEICQKNSIEGRVLVLFAINMDGTPVDFQILSESDPYLNQAAIDAVIKSGKWKPAIKDGKPIKVYTIAPVNFKLH